MLDILVMLSLVVLVPVGIIPLLIVGLIYETKIIVVLLMILFIFAIVKNGFKRYCIFGIIAFICGFLTLFVLKASPGASDNDLSGLAASIYCMAGSMFFAISTVVFAVITIIDMLSLKEKDDNGIKVVSNAKNNSSLLKIRTKCAGAELESILFNGEEMLHDGLTDWNRQAPILFPIVGKLKNDETIIDGNTYHMKQHGFARDCNFERIDENSYVLKYNDETLEKYPYKFELYVSYQMYGNSLITRYRVKNVDNKMICFGLGGHPAFKCDFNNAYLEFEWNEDEVEIYQLNNGLVKKECEDRRKFINGNRIILTPDYFDNDAVIMKKLKSNTVTLYNNGVKKLKFDFTNFPILAVWSKKGAKFLCIEPWLNTADAEDSNGRFEGKDGLIRLRGWTRVFCRV